MDNIFICVLVYLRMPFCGIHVVTTACTGIAFSDYASFPSTLLATWWILRQCFLTSTFDAKVAVSQNGFFLCDLLFLSGCLFHSLARKFNNFTRFCFSVLYSLLFILRHSDPIPSISLSFHFRDFPQFIIEYLLCSTGMFCFFSTPVLHILDLCCFSTKAVNLPLIASFLHSFPCVICSDFFPATLIWQWLAYNWHVLISRFGMMEVPAVWFLFFDFILKFCSIIFPPPYVLS